MKIEWCGRARVWSSGRERERELATITHHHHHRGSRSFFTLFIHPSELTVFCFFLSISNRTWRRCVNIQHTFAVFQSILCGVSDGIVSHHIEGLNGDSVGFLYIIIICDISSQLTSREEVTPPVTIAIDPRACAACRPDITLHQEGHTSALLLSQHTL